MNRQHLPTDQNPLLFQRDGQGPAEAHAKPEDLQSPTVFVRRKKTSHRRALRDARRLATAAEALADFDQHTQIHGLTKGQFSLIDVLAALLDFTGPAALDISTWTAATTDVTIVCDWLQNQHITQSRWLVDLTFTRRSPELAHLLRKLFGPDAIRVAQNHAKLAILRNAEWAVVLQTSMNLNFNPRFESFTVAHDPELADFYGQIFQEIWTRQPRKLDAQRPYEIHKYFAREM